MNFIISMLLELIFNSDVFFLNNPVYHSASKCTMKLKNDANSTNNASIHQVLGPVWFKFLLFYKKTKQFFMIKFSLTKHFLVLQFFFNRTAHRVSQRPGNPRPSPTPRS